MNNKLLYILILSLVIVAFFLIFEHRVHIWGNMQYVLFALFIGLHFFMHAGHGGHDKGSKKGGHH